MLFGVLGSVSVADGSGALVPVGPRIRRTLLAVLLCSPNRPVDPPTLGVALWGDQAGQRLDGLRVHVHHIRRTVGGDRLTRSDGGYLLRVEPGELDAAEFRRLVGEARAAEGDPHPARDLLRTALALWRGAAFADVNGPERVRAEAVLLESERVDALERCFGHELALGRHAEVAGEIRAAVDAEPYRERLWAQLMLALYRSGRRVEALAAFADLRDRLTGELGVDPGPPVQQLHLRILNDDPSLALRDARPARATAARPWQVPAAPNDFTGRAAYLRELDRAAEAAATAAASVTLVGMAGAGKSALAAYWAHRNGARFPDGQLFVGLGGSSATGARRPIDALARLLRALGVAADQVPVDVEEAAGLYRTMLEGRRVLVVLDDAHDADQVRPLLAAGPGCLTVVTSRDRLTGLVAVDGARRVTVDVLTGSESAELVGRLLGASRADREPGAVAELTRLCGHLPLALRIAAANLADGGGSTTAYADRLRGSHPLGELLVDGDDRSSVRGAFTVSYTALPPATRRFFRLLPLAPGSDLTAGAAAALTGTTPDRAAGHLHRLMRSHLVTHAAQRWSMHDLVRGYATERADAEETGAAREAAVAGLYDWLLHHVDAAARLRYPQALRLPATGTPASDNPHSNGVAAKAWLDDEIDNIAAAVVHARTDLTRQAAWRIGDALRNYFLETRDRVNWLAIARAALTAAEHSTNLDARSAMHHFVGDALFAVHRVAEATGHFERALDLARESGWLEAQGALLGGLGIVAGERGRLGDAIEHHRAALAVQQRAQRPVAQAIAYTNIGYLQICQGRPADAVDQLSRALALAPPEAAGRIRGLILLYLSQALRQRGEFDAAEDHIVEAVTAFTASGDRAGLAMALCGRADLYRARNTPDLALRDISHAISVSGPGSGGRQQSVLLTTLGAAHLHAGHTQQAADAYHRAVSTARAVDARYPLANALVGLSTSLSDVNASRRVAREAEAIARRDGYRIVEAEALCALAATSDGADDAALLTRRASDIFEAAGYRPALIT